MNDCVFCKIVSKEIPSKIIYENDLVMAFLDMNPDVNGHILIIPKKHYLDINDIDPNTLSEIFNVGKKLYGLLKEKLNIDGLTFIQNNGSAQEVKHYHLHLLARYKNDGFKTLHKKDDIKSIDEIYNIITN